MNVNFLNPFVEAAFEVLKAETGLAIQRGELSLEKSVYQMEDVTVIIALIGSVEGTVLYSMSNQTALALADAMMGENLQSFDSLAQSGIAELGNMITGRASVKLSEAGYEVTMSPPAMLLGKGATISTLDFPRLIVPLDMEYGRIRIHLALREGKNPGLKAAQIPIPDRPPI